MAKKILEGLVNWRDFLGPAYGRKRSAVNDVTSPRQGYAVHRKDLDAEHVSAKTRRG